MGGGHPGGDLTRRMPPWPAAPGYGHFANDPALTQGEWDLIVAWVDGGAPSGQTLAEERTPPVYVPADAAWDAGEPSLRLPMPEAHAVSADAADSVHRVDIVTPFTAPTRVHGLAFKPGDRRVVRYASVWDAATDRWLFTWTPWSTSMHLPEGTAYVLPAGARLRVDIGYRGTSEAVSDRSEVGFYFDDPAPGAVARPQTLAAPASTLPPGAAPTRLRGELVVAEPMALHALWPEPGSGATSAALTAYLPDGQVRPLLWLREPPPAWPAPYVYTEPVRSRAARGWCCPSTRPTPRPRPSPCRRACTWSASRRPPPPSEPCRRADSSWPALPGRESG